MSTAVQIKLTDEKPAALPTKQQLVDASVFFHSAAEHALIAYYTSDNASSHKYHGEMLLEYFAKSAAALGFTLVPIAAPEPTRKWDRGTGSFLTATADAGYMTAGEYVAAVDDGNSCIVAAVTDKPGFDGRAVANPRMDAVLAGEI